MNNDTPSPSNYAQLYGELVGDARFLPERSAQYMFFNALVRSLLQTAAYTAVEVLGRRVDDLADTEVPAIAGRMMRPTDGDTESLISAAIPLLAESGHGVAAKWFGPGEGDQPLRQRASAWCTHRNNRIGHGVVSDDVREEALSWLPQLAEDLIVGLRDLLPDIQPDGSATLETRSFRVADVVPIGLLRLHDGRPTVIRQITARGDRWCVKAQRLDPHNAPDISFEVSDSGFVRLAVGTTTRYRQASIALDDGSLWRPTVLLPARQTDTFEGRSEQLHELVEWMNDTDSRACNLYGEGGIGKTTLVLEVLNRLIEGAAPQVVWRPEVISFFSAKLTRWGPEGLDYLRGVAPSLDDAVRTLAMVYEDNLSKEWHSLSGGRLVDRVATLLRDLGIQRDAVLIVIDNTETISRSADDEHRLAEAIELITKRLGRVIITSRRREKMEARPLEVPSMTLEEGVRLVQRLAEVYDAAPILQAGEPGRRKLVNALSGHPIKLDACCRLIGRFGYGLGRAQQQVLSNADLGTFLYEDAWARVTPEQRIALASLAQMGDSLSGDLIHFLCSELQVDQTDLLDALEETKFATRFDYATQYDVRLQPSALSFLRGANEKLPPDARTKVGAAVAQASKRNAELLRAQDTVVRDRVQTAFRTDAAKAARDATGREDIEDAIFWYEEAIKVEPGNVALLDRFAFFLSSRARDRDRAWLLAQEACRLDPEYADAFFTAGHIAASRGDVRAADERLEQARALGFPPHRCDLQKARARVRELEADGLRSKTRPDDLINRLRDARRNASKAELRDVGGTLDRKHQYEVRLVEEKVTALAKRYNVIA